MGIQYLYSWLPKHAFGLLTHRRTRASACHGGGAHSTDRQREVESCRKLKPFLARMDTGDIGRGLKLTIFVNPSDNSILHIFMLN
jgi:hypothetical protein